MYVLLIAIGIATGLAVITHGVLRGRRWEAVVGGLILVVVTAFFSLLDLWGEMLWFATLGYAPRFWTVLLAKVSVGLAGVIAGGAIVWALSSAFGRIRSPVRYLPQAVGGVAGGLWGIANWAVVMKYWYGPDTGTREPIFGRDAAFYLFRLPFYDSLVSLLLILSILSLIAAVFASLRPSPATTAAAGGPSGGPTGPSGVDEIALRDLGKLRFLPIELTIGGLILALAARNFLAVFGLMFSEYGVVYGASWTDIHVRLPVYYVLAFLLGVVGLVLAGDAVIRRVRDRAASRRRTIWVASPLLVALVAWPVGLVLLPALFQWLYVQPNEVSVERPYIENNIRFTRQAFGLDRVEEKQFPVAPKFTREAAEQNREVLSQVRLWDPRALSAVYEQFQEIRLYYEFPDIDIDRYTINGDYRQVMVAPREMELGNLSEQSQTFVNRRFKYTHGYGLTMAPVSEFTESGSPRLLIKDLPPQSTKKSLRVERPEIYYGELTDAHVIVNTTEKEFDYPRGENNVYTRYDGDGGVQLTDLWRKFLYGWKFDGTRLFVSSYPTAESRIMFRRDVRQRVKTLAPFLHLDEDPYVVLDDGQLYWIVDAYTTSRYYPYSEPFWPEETTTYRRDSRQQAVKTEYAGYMRDINYVRNSVKVVVNAYDGSVDLYVFEPEDPLIRAWRKIVPGLFRPEEEMPDSLREHVRYPEGLLLVQGSVFARYHMTDPDVFYNQEDIWVRATEKYYEDVQAVEPYYVLWQPPGERPEAEAGRPEFILMQPFTPKNRQVLIGWIAGMCDGENYGRLLAYRFPKEERVLGTQQVETKIDQDSYLSEQLSLWDQRGSRVVRGNVLVIPVSDTLLYVEPIYLQSDAAAYPELRLVAVMHNDRLSYAETFREAIRGLYSDRADVPRPPLETRPAGDGEGVAGLARRAGDAFDRYLRALSDKDFDAANAALKKLSSTLDELNRRADGSGPETTDAEEPAEPVGQGDESPADAGENASAP